MKHEMTLVITNEEGIVQSPALDDVLMTETNAQELFKPVVAQAMDGDRDPLETYLRLRWLELAAKAAAQMLKDQAKDGACAWGKDRRGVIKSASFKVQNSGDRYDYDGHELVKKASHKAKAATDAWKKGMEYVDPDTGEIVAPAKKVSNSVEQLAVSFKEIK